MINIIVLSALAAVFADPGIDRAVQHDTLAWHLAQGERRAQVCATAEQYFGVRCADTGDEFLLVRGTGTDITYLATIHLGPEK